MILRKAKGEQIYVILDKIIFYGLCFIIFVLPLIYINDLKDAFLDAKNIFLQFTISVLICITILKYYLNKKDFSLKEVSLFLPLLILFFLCFISLFKAKNHYVSLESIYCQLCYTGIYFIVVLNNINVKRVYYLLHLNFIICFLVTIIPYVKNLFIFSYLKNHLSLELIQIGSTLGNQNFLSNYLIQTIPIGLFLIYNMRRIILKIFYFSIWLFIIFYFIKTKTVGAWFGLTISFLIVFLMQLKSKNIVITRIVNYKSKFLVSLIFLIIVIFVLNILFGNIFGLFNNFYNITVEYIKSNLSLIKTEISKTINITQHQSSLYRFYLWESCLKIIIANPIIGIGLNNFQFILPFYWSDKILELSPINILVLTKRAHNEYLQITAELGIIGLIVFLFLLYKVVKLCYSNIHKEALSNYRYVLSSFLTISIFSVFINSLFSFPLQTPVSAFNFWLLVGFQGLIFKNNQKSKIFVEKNYNRLNIYIKELALLFFIIFFFIFTVAFNYRKVYANFYFKKGLTKLISKDLKNVEYEFEKSNKYIPYDYELQYHLGRIYLEKGLIYDAEKNFIKSIELSDFHLSHYNLGIIYYMKGMLDKSIQEFEKSTKLYPLNNDAYAYLGILYTNKNNFSKALINFRESVKINDNYFLAYRGLGELFLKMEEKEKAKNELLKGLKIKKDDLLSIKILAQIYEENGNIAEAIKFYERYFEINKDISERKKVFEYISNLKKRLK